MKQTMPDRVAVDAPREPSTPPVAVATEQLSALEPRLARPAITKLLLATLDGSVVWLAAFLVSISASPAQVDDALTPVTFASVLSLTMVLLLVQQHLYHSRRLGTAIDESLQLLKIGLWTLGLFSFAAVASSEIHLDGGRLVMVISASTTALVLVRLAVRRRFSRARASGTRSRKVAVVGNGDGARELVRRLGEETSEYDVIGVVGEQAATADWLGSPEVAVNLLPSLGCEGVIIALGSMTPQECNQIVRLFSDGGFHVTVDVGLVDFATSRFHAQTIGRRNGWYVERPEPSLRHAVGKRLFDIVFSLLVMPIVIPILIVAAIATKLDSPGPFLFAQERTGRHGRPFRMLKVRTMVQDAEKLIDDLAEQNERDGAMFKIDNDPRITRVGAILRRYSIDELPQFFNVLAGHMSIVGPRPALPHEAAEWTPEVRRRILVQPGITGLWQVAGRTDSRFSTYVKLDNRYVDGWSMAGDLHIVLLTARAIVAGTGT